MFSFLRHQSWHFVSFVSLRNTRCQSTCFGEQVGSKYGTWYSERAPLQFMCVGSWAGVTYLRYAVLMSPKEEETAVYTVAILLYRFLSSVLCQSCLGIGNPPSKCLPGKTQSYDSLRAHPYFQSLHHRVRRRVVCGGARTPANSITTSKCYVKKIKWQSAKERSDWASGEKIFFGMKGLGECIMEPARGLFVELLTLISFSPHAKMTSAIWGKISLFHAFSSSGRNAEKKLNAWKRLRKNLRSIQESKFVTFWVSPLQQKHSEFHIDDTTVFRYIRTALHRYFVKIS